MRRLIAAGLLLAAEGCMSTGSAPDYTPRAQSAADTKLTEHARSHVDLAAGYYDLGRYAIALEEANVAVQIDPNYAPAYRVLGMTYMALRDDRNAEQNFQRALRLDPVDPETNDSYGMFLCQRKREQEGIKYFLTALRNPLYATPEKSWVNAGVCAEQTGDTAAAEDYFQKALGLNPSQPQSLFHLAEIAYRRDDLPAAKSYLLRLPPEVTPNAKLLWLELRVERKLGNRSGEASYGFQLRKNFPDSPETQALLAGRYE
jgi:type IV pilus assembly protein PilF